MPESRSTRQDRIWPSLPLLAQAATVLLLPLPCLAIAVVVLNWFGVYSLRLTLTLAAVFESAAGVWVLGAVARHIGCLHRIVTLVRQGKPVPSLEPSCWDVDRLGRELATIATTLEQQRDEIQECERRAAELDAALPPPQAGVLAGNPGFRKALTGVKGFAEMLYDGKAGLISPEQREYLADILASARELWRIADELDDLPAPEAAPVSGGRREPIQLRALLHEVRFALTAQHSEKPCQVYVDVDPAVEEIFADGIRLKQVLHSFLEGSMHSCPDAGLLTLRGWSAEGGWFRVEVADNHPAIGQDGPLEVERRYPVHEFSLALAKHLVELEGGRVGMLRSPVRGNVIYAVLPAGAEPAEACARPASSRDKDQGETAARPDPASRPVAVVAAPTRKTA